MSANGAAGVPLALYVHLPWCVRKCPYCDFNSHQLATALPDPAYIDLLLADLDADAAMVEGRRVGSVFFGGGTPSLFAPESYDRLLRGLRGRVDLADDAEVTLEANPGTIERGRFEGYLAAGINRISLGAQSFAPAALSRLGRIHGAEEIHRAVDELLRAGCRNFNLDLMYGLPGQTVDEALYDVDTACALGAAHLSHYQLTLEPGTVFYARPPALPDEDATWHMQIEAQRRLAAAGYRQYEISAYARSGFQCRHNLNYWHFGDYLGIGAGAHGKLTLSRPERIVRTVKPRRPAEYRALIQRSAAEGCNLAERSIIGMADLPFEFMLNSLRLNAGFELQIYELATGLPIAQIEPKLLDASRRGLLERTDNGWKATDMGRRFLNDLQARFLN